MINLIFCYSSLPHDFHIASFNPNNGTKGVLPVTPAEWIPGNLQFTQFCVNWIQKLTEMFYFTIFSMDFRTRLPGKGQWGLTLTFEPSTSCNTSTSSQHNSELFYWHKHCVELLKPSTLIHIAEKFLQLAATNCTDAGHSNTLLILQL